MINLFMLFSNVHCSKYEISLDKKVLDIFPDDSDCFVTKDGVSSKASPSLLEKVIIHPGITEVKDSSFYDFIKLTSIELPNGLKYLQRFSLRGCVSLKTIELPYGFIKIYDQAFSGCSSLENITLSSTVEAISLTAFEYCTSLSNYFLSAPNPIFSTDSTGTILIASGTIAVFGPATNKTVRIPDQIKTINNYFLSTFKDVEAIDFGDAHNLTRIEKQAFRHTNITRIIYPEGLEYVGDIVLEGIDIEFVSVPSTLKSHGGIFSPVPKEVSIHPDCKCLQQSNDGIVYNREYTEIALVPNGVTSVHISSAVETINIKSITSCKTLSKLSVDSLNLNFSDYKNALYDKSKYTLLACPGGLKSIEISSLCGYIQSYSLKVELDDLIFEQPRSINLIISGLSGSKVSKDVVFPETLQSVSTYGMSGFSAPSVTFPSTLKTIYVEAMISLKVKKIDFFKCQHITSIPTSCFVSSEFEEILLPPNIEKLGISALRNCTLLKSIEFPSSVTSISDSCFYNCTSLSSCSFLGQNIESIGTSAFKLCNIISLEFPRNVKILSTEVFASNPNLKDITFPNDSELTTIQLGVFKDSDKIESIHLPPKIQIFSSGAFCGMGGLQSITIDSSNTYFESNDGILYTKNLHELIAFPGGRKFYSIHESVRSFGESAFFMCKKLESVFYEKEVALETIKEQTFLECQRFASIMIPGSVSSISALSFSGCISLENVSFGDGSKVKKIVTTTFSDCNGLKRISFGSFSSLEEIEDNVFFGLSKLCYFEAPLSLRIIGAYAFYGCKKLESFRLFNISKIHEGAFEGCTLLKEITLGPNLTILGERSFAGCRELKTVKYCGQNLFTNHTFDEDTQLLAALVPISYNSDEFGGIMAIRILDPDCQLPTFAFTVVENVNIAIPLTWSIFALNDKED